MMTQFYQLTVGLRGELGFGRISDQDKVKPCDVMAKLQFKTAGFDERVVELRLGHTRLGREPENDIPIPDPTVSGRHCELTLEWGGLSVRDCGSTNGTFIDGTPVQDAVLLPGQTLRLGDIELLVADTWAPIRIPTFEVPTAAPPVVLSNGAIQCRRHRAGIATYRCTHCRELLCEECLHRLRRRGGNQLCLCPLCSYPVEVLGGEKRKRKTILDRLRETTKMILGRATRGNHISAV